jgi:outer membrane protein assembly factor BamB
MLKGRAVLFPLLSAALLVLGLASCKKNRPPDVPTVPTGPGVCFKDTTYTFTTIANDPDGDSVAVRFDWGDSTLSDWKGWFPGGDSIALAHAWPDTGTYEVRAWAEDQKQLTSNLSGGLTVRVVLRRPPNKPNAPTGPDVGGKDSSYTFAAAAFHPDSITVAIRFSWGDGDTSGWSPYVACGESVRMNHAWSAPNTYAVMVQAKDTGNALSQWSAPDTVIIRPPDTLRIWRFQLAAGENISLNSSPAIGTDGTIYVGSSDSALYAVNPDGTLKWRFLTGRNVESSPAIAPDGIVYFGSDDHYVYSVNPDGILKWRYSTDGDVTSPAIAADGTVYVDSRDGYLYALNPDSTLKWRYPVGGRMYGSPAIAADGTVYVGSNGDTLCALKPDGTLRWQYGVGEDIRSSPAIGSDGTVYFGAEHYGGFRALNPDGTMKWRCFYKTVRASPAIASDGTVYIGSSGTLYALNADSTQRWTYVVGGSVLGSAAVAADGTVYFGSADNYLYALNPDGTLKWRYETGDNIVSSPAISPDGTIYFTSCDGYLYAIKGTSPLADSPWPKSYHDLKNTGRVGGGRY